MKFWISNHVRSCDTCKQANADHSPPRGILASVSISVQKSQSIAMDWICVLPEVTFGDILYDQVLTITDQATTIVHLVPTFKADTAEDTAEQFLQ